MLSPRILVVEDEQLIADDLKETLEQLGYDVPMLIPSGEIAVSQAPTLNPDLVLMDIHLDGALDGIEASKKIQACLDVPIVFLTANADRSTLERLKAADPFGYLLKPYNEKVLGTTIEIALSRHRLESKARQAQSIAEERRAAAESHNRQKSEYLAMTAHEFRNPLSAIQLAAELLQERGETLSKKKQQKHLQRIYTATHHLNEILDKMLILEQADLGKLTCRPVPVEVIQFCREQVELIQTSVEKPHCLSFSASVDQCIVNLDPNLLGRLLGNLLSNAIKYSLEGGSIQFTVELESDCVQFQIRDQGIGIPSTDQGEIFQPFYRADNVSGVSGTGLGLAIAKQCVDLHRGQIWLESTVGQGTTVFVSLPR